MSRGRNVCSVDDRKVNKGGAKAVMAVAEIRAPIGKKFVRQKTTEKDDKSKMVSETVYEQWMDSVIENGVKNIRREYLELVRSYVPSGTQRAWESDKNYDKNRQKIDSFKEDYINASYVDVGEGLKFIAAQGPMSNTIQDFWIMVIQEEVKVSVTKQIVLKFRLL
ncbi:unnamed protein product [Gongylonema pulchrum]|uniref:Tyrosine-protein phosphatase domain-containing protein n=1 Tax=Gongylonema pulchrum TaxID=637853 RepID=A0A183E6J0_9BILA|nr:unnamed protein product [Gongylonema pulchrum]